MKPAIMIMAMVFYSTAAAAVPLNAELEEAAVIGVGMSLCDTNSGVGSGGWNDLIMRGANRMHISQEAAGEVVQARQREIITHLNKRGQLDEFCQNIRAGKV